MFYSPGTCDDVKVISNSVMDGSHLVSMDTSWMCKGLVWLVSFQSHLELFCVGFLERILSVMERVTMVML